MNSLLKFSTLCLAFLIAFSCTEAPKSTTSEKTASQNNADSIAITDAVHNFYKWYDAFTQDQNRNINYVDSKGKASKLDMAQVAVYHAELMKSGFLSKTYFDNDLTYLKKYEAEWQKNNENNEEGPLSGLDYDRIFCGQDWDLATYTTGALKLNGLGTNQVKTLIGTNKLELAKENGKWLIAKIDCE